VIVKIDPLGEAIEIFSAADRVAEHRRARKGERVIVEDHVAALRRPRLERLRERSGKTRAKRAGRFGLLSPVGWPAVEVALRPIEEYAAVAGGER
jgi:hypothetical protein